MAHSIHGHTILQLLYIIPLLWPGLVTGRLSRANLIMKYAIIHHTDETLLSAPRPRLTGPLQIIWFPDDQVGTSVSVASLMRAQ